MPVDAHEPACSQRTNRKADCEKPNKATSERECLFLAGHDLTAGSPKLQLDSVTTERPVTRPPC